MRTKGWFARLDASALDSFYYYTSDAQTSSAYNLENIRVGYAPGFGCAKITLVQNAKGLFIQRGFDMITLTLNGEPRDVDVPGDMPLLWVLRDVLALTGTKFGCGIAQCGACTVHLEGEPVRSCRLPVGSIGKRRITTIEAIGSTTVGAKVQKAWLDLEVIQCGYCQSGQIMSATALLATTPSPDDADIDAAMAGNICRCGTYVRIREAIKQAARS